MGRYGECVRILVTGATGYVGSRLIPVLLGAGNQVVAASQNVFRLNRFGWRDDVAEVTVDACDEASTRAAFAAAGHIDVVYYPVHGIGPGPLAAAVRSGLDIFIRLTPKVSPA